MPVSLLFEAVRALREDRPGDAAVCKAVALTAAPYPAALAAVRALAEPLPDLAARLAEPTAPGSLGRAYADFVSGHGIAPLSLSAGVRARVAPLNLLAARYVLVHDLFHVVLGFGIDRPGELAVWSFVAAQRYSPSYETAAALARVLYPVAQPSAFAELRRQRARAIGLAGRSPCLIGRPFEHDWSTPLAQVRARLGLAGDA